MNVVKKPGTTSVKRLDYEDVRAYFESRHRMTDDSEFWAFLTGDGRETRYVALSIEDVLVNGSDGAANFAGALQKEYKESVLVFDTLKRRRILAPKQPVLEVGG